MKKIIFVVLVGFMLSGCAYNSSHDLLDKSHTYKYESTDENCLIKTIEHENGRVTRIYNSDLCY